MPLLNLKLQNVGPFEDIEFEFDEHVNLFVGPNNSGKSTVLWALGDIAVNPFSFPRKLLHKERSGFSVSYTKANRHRAVLKGEFPIWLSEDGARIKGFWNEERYQEHLDLVNRLGYSCFTPAFRRSTDFRSKGPRPGDEESSIWRQVGIHRLQEVNARVQELRQMGRSDEAARLAASLEGPDAMEMEDSGVIQAIVDLDYRSYRENQPRIRKIIEGIGSIVSEITEGFPVKFVGVGEDKRGLFPRFKTPDGLMALNTLSQGTQSLIQWLGHFLINLARYYGYPDEIASKRSVLIIDEIDAHLHPSWQRRILPALTKAFPRLQIFCSSHSPLMPTGLKAGQVHLLSRDSRNRVTVSRNETDVVGWSADEILRGLMDVSDPIDLETVEQLERLQTLRQKKRLSKHDASELDSLRKNVGSKLSTGPATNKILAMAAELAAPAHSGRKGNGPRVRRAAKNASSGK